MNRNAPKKDTCDDILFIMIINQEVEA